jgi:hypothetical protein
MSGRQWCTLVPRVRLPHDPALTPRSFVESCPPPVICRHPAIPSPTPLKRAHRRIRDSVTVITYTDHPGRASHEKTRTLHRSTLALRLGQSVVATDVKGDLLDMFLAYVHAHGALGVDVAKWDFTDPSRSPRWDWLAELADDGSLDAAVTAILGRESKQSSADPFFYRRDATLLRGLLREAPRALRPPIRPKDLVTFLSRRDELLRYISAAPSYPRLL